MSEKQKFNMVQESETMIDLFSDLKKKYGVPDKWKNEFYFLDDRAIILYFDKVLSGKEKIDGAKVTLHPTYLYADQEDRVIRINKHEGVIETKDFVAVIMRRPWERDMNCFVFTDMTLKEFETFIYPPLPPTEKPEYHYGDGLYSIGHGMFGPFLISVQTGELTRPILNGSIYQEVTTEIDRFTERKEIYKDLGLEYKRGILFWGPPGNGKTSFIKYVCKNLEALSVIVDVNNSDDLCYVKDLIANEKYKDRLKVIILEDIDGAGNYGRSAILNMLDGISAIHKTIFFATTNFPERLDIAMRNRPSRFDCLMQIGEPDSRSREKLLKTFFKDLSNGELNKCIKDSDGFNGAYFKEIFIVSRLHDLTPHQAVKKVRERFTQFGTDIKDLGDQYSVR